MIHWGFFSVYCKECFLILQLVNTDFLVLLFKPAIVYIVNGCQTSWTSSVTELNFQETGQTIVLNCKFQPVGSYGAAVLYRKKDDDSLVILKEINMHDLTAQERQLATNEVQCTC